MVREAAESLQVDERRDGASSLSMCITFLKKVLDRIPASGILSLALFGALAQLGERMAGSHEVRGSIPLGSTIGELDEHRFNWCSSFFGGVKLSP